MFNNSPPPNWAVYRIVCKNIVEPDRPQTKIRHIHFARWITDATDIHPKCVTIIVFPWQ
jgi:hypothetical protein